MDEERSTSDELERIASQLLGRRRHERPGDVLMATLIDDGILVAPGVYHAHGAKTARDIFLSSKASGRDCAFNAVYGSGWAISAMLWGLPDLGFHDLSMMSLVGEYIVRNAHPLPVILDAETGFGNSVAMAERTVQKYDDIGVALAHLEDQGSARRCGNLRGKTCIPAEEMVEKIRSWLVASEARGTSMRLMVRTDALTAAGGGFDDAVERGKRYMGVEYRGLRPTVLWADAMMDLKEIEQWAAIMHKHDPSMILGINYSPNKDWTGHYRKKYDRTPPTYQELRDMGFKLMWHTILQARADMESEWNTFNEMAQRGAEVLWNLHERQRSHPVGNAQRMSGADAWQCYEQLIGGEAAVERFQNSKGYAGDKKS